MYITASTYGGIDWHDSRTIHEQLKSSGSYNIEKDKVPEAIADDIAGDFPYVEDIREKVLQALSENSCFHFMVKSEEKDSTGNVLYKDCAVYEDDGQIYYEAGAAFDGEKMTLTQEYAFGQISYTTSYYVEDIPDDQLGYIVTEDFLAPYKGIPVVQRMYHDIFDGLDDAQSYAESLRLHEFQYPTSIVTLLVCNREKVSQDEWYLQQKKAMELMEEKGQTHLDGSFHIFVKCHIENLKKLENRKETA
ncbi:hypothetical protein D3Z47_04660 [Lachnospiraceae bacterium]|nr:hypothetical protein [Lachnospiraceae bacterium]